MADHIESDQSDGTDVVLPLSFAPGEITPANGQRQTREPVLTETDIHLLAQAIKAGMTPDPPSSGDVAFALAKLALAIAFLTVAYVGLHWWHPHVSESYKNGVTATLNSLTLGSSSGAVNWAVPGVYASTLDLSGPANRPARVILPVQPADCKDLARRLGLTCLHGALVEPFSLAAFWNSPQLWYLSLPTATTSQAATQQSQQLALSLPQPANTPAEAAKVATGTGSSTAADTTVKLDLIGSEAVTWCAGAPTPGATLTLQSGSNSAVVPRTDIVNTACEGLTVDVQPSSPFVGVGRPPETTFSGVSSFSFQASSNAVDAQALSGVLLLDGAGTFTLAPPAEVALATDAAPVHTNLDISGHGSELTLTSSKLSSATDGGPNLVNSWWDRENNIALPLFLATCGGVLALVSPLADNLRKWRGATKKAKVKP